MEFLTPSSTLKQCVILVQPFLNFIMSSTAFHHGPWLVQCHICFLLTNILTKRQCKFKVCCKTKKKNHHDRKWNHSYKKWSLQKWTWERAVDSHIHIIPAFHYSFNTMCRMMTHTHTGTSCTNKRGIRLWIKMFFIKLGIHSRHPEVCSHPSSISPFSVVLPAPLFPPDMSD